MRGTLNKIYYPGKEAILKQFQKLQYTVYSYTQYSFALSKRVWFGKEIIWLEFDHEDRIIVKMTEYEYTGIFKIYNTLKWKLIQYYGQCQ
ncbi:hypothetical protein ACL0VS_17495 [Chryseobacterium sp. PMSZPI]|uniref:hypothetical protein n=1 Tax=Chryseobacterium sp. PMSZPI TaxID=1033900 RepID=UPI0039A0C344